VKTRIVKVVRPVVEFADENRRNGMWRVHDENLEFDEWFYPSDWMRECVGGRAHAYFRAAHSADEGWVFRQVLRKNFLW
jgi:hypothetical protein